MNAPAVLNEPIKITQYEKLTTDIALAAEKDAAVSFDYRKQNKLARSHVFSLRTLKGQIESARKDAKKFALDYGKRVDTAAKELSDKVEALILPHEAEIKKIEQEEADRIAAHKLAIDRIVRARDWTAAHASTAIASELELVKEISTARLEEFKAEADAELLASIKHLEAAHVGALKREQDAAELARLRAEQAEREEKERIERIQREAVEAQRRLDEAAKIRAEQAAKEEQARKDRAAKEKIERAKLAEEQAKVEAARAELRAKEAEARAAEMAKREKEAQERCEREQAEIEARRIARETAERENRTAMVRQIAYSIEALGNNPTTIAEAIVSGAIANVRVDWEV